MTTETKNKAAEKPKVETIEVSGNQLVEKVKSLAADASVRRMKIIAEDGDVFLDTPLSVGLVVGGVVVLAAPWLAILGTIAGLIAKARIEVEREAEEDDTKADA